MEQPPALHHHGPSAVQLMLVQVLVQALRQEPQLPMQPSFLKLGLELELGLLLGLASRVLPLVVPPELEPELVPESALETMAAPLRIAPACLGHRPPEAQPPSDDQMPHHHPAQHPRNRT